MMQINLGVTGAKRTAYAEANLRELAMNLAIKNPHVDEDQLRDLLILKVKEESDWIKQSSEEDYIDVCILYACTNAVRNMIARTPANKAQKNAHRKEARNQQKQEAKTATTSKLKTVVERRARQLILDTVMPNGKLMKDVTGTYLAKLGGGYSRVAKAAGAKKIGEALNETEVRKLMSKNT